MSADNQHNSQKWRVQIGSRSFGKVYPEQIQQLEKAGCIVVPNGVGRAYNAGELMEALQEADAIITGTDELTAAVIEGAPKLKTIAKHGIGLETIDLDAARQRGIVVSATPQAVSDAVADLRRTWAHVWDWAGDDLFNERGFQRLGVW